MKKQMRKESRLGRGKEIKKRMRKKETTEQKEKKMFR